MLRLTLDTSSVIHGAQEQEYGAQIDELVDLARGGRVGLWITTAFAVDQEGAPADKHRRNLEWLAQRPLIGSVPGLWRFDYSGFDGPEVDGPDRFVDDRGAAVDEALRQILRRGSTSSRRKITDVQHLTAHFMAGHDAFVTSDQDDMLHKRQVIQQRTGIVVVDPSEAVAMAHRQGP
jgi:hypothetical protein